MIDGNFGNVSAGVSFRKSRIKENGGKTHFRRHESVSFNTTKETLKAREQESKLEWLGVKILIY